MLSDQSTPLSVETTLRKILAMARDALATSDVDRVIQRALKTGVAEVGFHKIDGRVTLSLALENLPSPAEQRRRAERAVGDDDPDEAPD